MRSIVMFTGVPGSGKTTLMEEVVRKMRSDQVRMATTYEYDYVCEWARLPENRENQQLVRVIGESFDLFPAAYRPMSEYVARRLSGELSTHFEQGAAVVVFEIARGVGKPRADYAPFVESLVSSLGEWKRSVGLANIEVVADVKDIGARMRTRFEADPTAPPPGIEWKYLDALGRPLCYASEDLVRASLGIPLVLNEMVRNGADIETLREEVERELYPRLVTALGIPLTGVEGNQRGIERWR